MREQCSDNRGRLGLKVGQALVTSMYQLKCFRVCILCFASKGLLPRASLSLWI